MSGGHSREGTAKRAGRNVICMYGGVRGALRRYLAAEPPTRLAAGIFRLHLYHIFHQAFLLSVFNIFTYLLT